MAPRRSSPITGLVSATAVIVALAGCAAPPAANQPKRGYVNQIAANTVETRDEALSTRQRQRIQKILNALGYGAGAADGVIGQQTRRAIRAYQRDREFRVDGRVTRRLLRALNADARRQGLRIANRPVNRLAQRKAPANTPVRNQAPTVTNTPTETPTATETPTFTRRTPAADSESDSDSSGGGWN